MTLVGKKIGNLIEPKMEISLIKIRQAINKNHENLWKIPSAGVEKIINKWGCTYTVQKIMDKGDQN